MSAGALIISRRWPTDPACVVFRVVDRTCNGWLRCHVHAEQNGTPIPGDAVFRFRASEMEVWNGGPS